MQLPKKLRKGHCVPGEGGVPAFDEAALSENDFILAPKPDAIAS